MKPVELESEAEFWLDRVRVLAASCDTEMASETLLSFVELLEWLTVFAFEFVFEVEFVLLAELELVSVFVVPPDWVSPAFQFVSFAFDFVFESRSDSALVLL